MNTHFKEVITAGDDLKLGGGVSYQPPCPPMIKVLLDPSSGDTLCFDGKEWRVARYHGWAYPVEKAG